MQAGDIIIVVMLVVGALVAGLYFLNRWAYRKMDDQQAMIEKTKMSTAIYVIDKKKDNIKNVNMPKAVIEQMPKMYRFMKLYFVKAKVGPQIVTLMCDKKVFKVIQLKKSVKVELAGIYIVNIKGMKTEAELKKAEKEKKAKEKLEKKEKK